jgi:hypothetical protein
MERSARGTSALSRSLLGFFVAVVASYAAVLYVRHALGTVYYHHDDEGYVLLSLKHYLDGDRLYTQTFTQYGPFYYLVVGGIFRLFHLPVDLDYGRLVLGIFWLLSSAVAAYFVFRLSKSSIMAGAAALASTFLAYVLTFEPNHPQELIFPILMLSCCVSLAPGAAGMAVLGALGTALLFTKINVGVFFLVALFQALVCVLPAGRLRRAGIVLACAYAAAFPFLVMRRDVATWAGGYCFVATLCGLSTVIFGLMCGPRESRAKRMMLYGALGGVAAGAVILAVTMWQGVSLSVLLRGVVLDPLKRSALFEVPDPVTGWEGVGAFLITAAIAGLYWLRRYPRIYTDLVSVVRCFGGLWAIVVLYATFQIHPELVAALPLILLPPSKGEWKFRDYFPRLFLAVLSATQFLQPYPVAGSQVSISAASLLLWAFVCFYDGAQGMADLVQRRTGGFAAGLTLRSILTSLLFIWLTLAMLYGGIWRGRFTAPASALRGAHHLHLPKKQEDLYVPVAEEIRANCDVLFTMPGMGSFNFWSGIPTPNGFNLTAWMTEFTPQQEYPILKIIQNDSRSCVLYNAAMVSAWGATPEDVENSPLGKFIVHDMPIVYERKDYQIRVNPKRQAPWVQTDTAQLP